MQPLFRPHEPLDPQVENHGYSYSDTLQILPLRSAVLSAIMSHLPAKLELTGKTPLAVGVRQGAIAYVEEDLLLYLTYRCALIGMCCSSCVFERVWL